MAPTLQSGDSVLLAEGDEWIVDDTVFLVGMATPAGGAPLTFASYTPAWLPAGSPPRPHIRRNTTANPVGPVVQTLNAQGLAFRGLELSGAEDGFAFFFNTSGAVATFTGVHISDCHFHDLHGAFPNASSAGWWGYDIGFGSAYAGVTVEGITIENK